MGKALKTGINNPGMIDLIAHKAADEEYVLIISEPPAPEKFRSATGKKFEAIGETLAKDCANNKSDFWKNDFLKHNEPELSRLIEDVRPTCSGRDENA